MSDMPTNFAQNYDFDNFNEDAVIASIRKDIAVKYIILEQGKFFVARFADGKQVKVPLLFSVQTADSLDKLEADGVVGQFTQLLANLGVDEDTTSIILSHSMVEVEDFATKYFEVVQKLSGATLPESRTSSESTVSIQQA